MLALFSLAILWCSLIEVLVGGDKIISCSMTQMDEPMKSEARLEVSVSFGRFENDALSWEKWSTFSPNKYLEEAGNLSTPGSVAQKKAYFEAHYKKIAARKAELEQEKMMVPIIRCPVVSSKEDCVTDSSDIDSKSGLSNGDRSVEDVGEESCTAPSENGPVFDEVKDDDSESPKGDDQEASMNGSITGIALEEDNANAAVMCETPVIDEAKNELNGNAEGPQLSVREDDVLVVSPTPQPKDSCITTGKPSVRKSGKEQMSALKKGSPKLNGRNSAQKVTPTKKERTLPGTRSKVNSPASAPPLVKQIRASTTRNLKPAPISTPVSAPKILKKQVNESPLLKSKNSPAGKSKRAAPSSLHMSLSLSSANSLAAAPMTRRSLIMEKMGDKDIVKRAFKSFQNRTNGSTIGEKSSPIKQMSPTAFPPKIAASRNLTKGNEGKDSVSQTSQRSQSGTTSNPQPKRIHKSSTVERKNTLAFSPTTGLRNDEKAERRREFLKKLEAKSIAREADRVAQLSVQSKVRSGSEIHPQRPTFSK